MDSTLPTSTGQADSTFLHRLAADHHRPQAHFLPPSGWLNDPNGLLWWKSEMHLFYQHNPLGGWHERIHWGHAVSHDLVHWRHLPIALVPREGEFDGDGCFSGSAVNDNGLPTIFYTGVWPQVMNRAVSRDGMLTWEKDLDNPLLAGPPAPYGGTVQGDFRDPFVWREGDEWWMVIGSQHAQTGGVVLSYRSDDLRHWHFVGPFLAGRLNSRALPWNGSMWECPNVLRFGDETLLLISPQSAPSVLIEPVWHSGCIVDGALDSQRQGVLVHGHTFYAPQVTRLEDGRWIMWGWLKEGRTDEAQRAAGWSGAMSLPLEVTLDAEGNAVVLPAGEVNLLRGAHTQWSNVALGKDAFVLPGVSAERAELVLDLEMDEASKVGIVLSAAPDSGEETILWLDGPEQELRVDRSRSSRAEDAYLWPATAPLALGGRVQLHIFVDASVIEIFADGGRTVLMSRIYPQSKGSGVALFCRGGKSTVTSLDAWELMPIW